ncbi:DUF1311 domain-containing protein [Phreatobacter aquaticus]|uniref:DUF1311 domain-containing protein n=1 Tax=Phreatobacter aquaticus TaxID=2570229 RepID=A0A4D7QNK1_9HYPH|nr:lysozyme inhibitor LprI family protein [Phreatobacter aquaticus]QCK86864.1 DUF1311 domain-containing protein [Phreatobacter aquaticus]
MLTTSALLRPLLVALICGLSVPAFAGARPDVSIAGRWRVVVAERAPWNTAPTLATPLMRSGLVFRDGRLEGPAPIACAPADFEIAMVPAEGLFQGALPADRAVDLGARLGVVGPGETVTYRVTCPNGSFDFHRATDSISLKFALDGVVYTLRQPEQDDGSRPDAAFVQAAPAGFDCGRARSTAERLICADADTTRLDGEMAAAFGRLRLALSAEGREALVAAQRVFLGFRDRQCRTGGAMPRGDEERRQAIQCLGEVTGARADLLKSLTVRRIGDLIIEPHLTTRWETRASDGSEARSLLMDDVVPVASGPGADMFNRVYRAAIPTGRPLDVALYRQRMPDLVGTLTRTYDISLADGRMVSLVVTGHIETGTRVSPDVKAVTIDRARGRLASLGDIFRVDEAFRAAIRERIVTQARERNQSPAREDMDRRIADAGNWSFQADKAVLLKPWLGSDPEELEIPANELVPFLRPDGLWRPRR